MKDFDSAKIVGGGHRVAQVGSLWRHKKTGNIYAIVAHTIIEATLQPAVVYGKPGTLVTWCRPTPEFFDGRFERV